MFYVLAGACVVASLFVTRIVLHEFRGTAFTGTHGCKHEKIPDADRYDIPHDDTSGVVTVD